MNEEKEEISPEVLQIKSETPKTETNELKKEFMSWKEGFSKKIEELNIKMEAIRELAKESSNPENKKSNSEQLKALNREKNRLIRFQSILEKWTDEEKELLKDENIDSVKAKKLLQIDNKKEGFLASTFAYKQVKNADGNIEEVPLDYNKIVEWDDISIDFGSNANANWKIGAGDILPPSIKVVKITDNEWNSIIWTRQSVWNKVGYCDETWRYIPIFNWYSIHIPTNEDLTTPEYKKSWQISSIITNVDEINKLKEQEKSTKEIYLNLVDKQEEQEKISSTIIELWKEIWETKTYKEKLQKLIEKAEFYINSEDTKYKKEDLELIISRLSKTVEILWDNDFGFDWDKYKESIANIESRASWLYFARNDSIGKQKHVKSDDWAFGKYQFTVGTLKWFWINLGNPPDEWKIQDFLSNSTLQEEIMDKFMLKAIETRILPNEEIMQQIRSWRNMWFYLAMWHIWWPGKIWTSGEWKDWLGTPVWYYASKVEKCMS